MSERVLRDELEQLQTQGRDLEAELLVEHGAPFLSQRHELTLTLASTRGELAEQERAVLTAQAEERAAKAQVDRLESELHAVEQRQLSTVPFALLPMAFAVMWMLLKSGLAGATAAPAASACALSLGLLFVPGFTSGRSLDDSAGPSPRT